VRSLLIAPVLDGEGKVIGLVELINKEGRDSREGFNADDERLLAMLCSHCSIFLKHLGGYG
tara:strand:+ start:76 stop:258 length:183 start_codon:yes stop_codon:yes gene_type:complete